MPEDRDAVAVPSDCCAFRRKPSAVATHRVGIQFYNPAGDRPSAARAFEIAGSFDGLGGIRAIQELEAH